MDNICSICLLNLDVNSSYMTNCNHYFHIECICMLTICGTLICPLCEEELNLIQISELYNIQDDKISNAKSITEFCKLEGVQVSKIYNINIIILDLSYDKWINNIKNYMVLRKINLGNSGNTNKNVLDYDSTKIYFSMINTICNVSRLKSPYRLPISLQSTFIKYEFIINIDDLSTELKNNIIMIDQIYKSIYKINIIDDKNILMESCERSRCFRSSENGIDEISISKINNTGKCDLLFHMTFKQTLLLIQIKVN